MTNGLPELSTVVVFDGDDTLWSTEVLYDMARARAAEAVAADGLDPEQWSVLQREVDLENVRTMGLSADRFPLSSVQAYDQLAAAFGRAPSAEARRAVDRASRSVFDMTAEPVAGAADVVEAVAAVYPCALLTKGEPWVQRKRLDDSGLKRCFRRVEIVPRKRPEAFVDLVGDLGGDIASSWSVGNSLASDIGPAVAAGMEGAWIDAHVWGHERREPPPFDGHVHPLDDIRELPPLLGIEVTAGLGDSWRASSGDG
jgi:putative hydrolase of the HAD superfamily